MKFSLIPNPDLSSSRRFTGWCLNRSSDLDSNLGFVPALPKECVRDLYALGHTSGKRNPQLFLRILDARRVLHSAGPVVHRNRLLSTGSARRAVDDGSRENRLPGVLRHP